MRAINLSRKLHKWLGFAVGIQLLVWALSGFYMVVVNIDIIHGDMLVKRPAPTLGDTLDRVLTVTQIQQQHPQAQQLTLQLLAQQPVYLLTEADRSRLLDAVSGEQISPLDANQATALADLYYAGSGAIARVQLIERDSPGEIRGLPLPVWRVDFDDAWGSSFYIDPQTGRLATRRHTLWRVFDFLWMLHIMDYDEREDLNNLPLRVLSLMALLLVGTGTWLLVYSFRRTRRATISS